MAWYLLNAKAKVKPYKRTNKQVLESKRKGVSTMGNLPQYVDEKKVAEITGLALSTLRNSRLTRSIPIPYCKIGRSVRYALADIIEFMESRKIVPQDN